MLINEVSLGRRMENVTPIAGDTVMWKAISFVVMIGFVGMMSGCASKPQETGFLSTYKNLEPADGNLLRYTAPNSEIAKYSKLIVDPVTSKFYDPKSAKSIKPEELAKMEQAFYAELTKDLTDAGFDLVGDPGPDVGRIRLAITDVKAGTPALNVIPQTKLTGLGLGAVSAEFELVDSVTGQQIAAAIDSDTGSRLSFSGLSKWGDAQAVLKGWAKKITERLKAARGG
jgi:hypothetical protein